MTTSAEGEYCGVCGKMVYPTSTSIHIFTQKGKCYQTITKGYCCAHIPAILTTSPYPLPLHFATVTLLEKLGAGGL